MSVNGSRISGGIKPYLRFVVYRTEGVEELKRCDDLALEQYGCKDRGCSPVSCTWRHLKEPLLQWELADLSHTAISSTQHGSHDPRNELKEWE